MHFILGNQLYGVQSIDIVAQHAAAAAQCNSKLL
jgi:hypothetical protein